jgi:phage baseplate assembly protein gpV
VNQIEDLKRRITQLERLVIGAKEFEATVTNVGDPDGLNRIKVECVNIWGEGNESPWLIDRCNIGGNSVGTVFTPTIGDLVSIRLRDGRPDCGEWIGGFRSSRSVIPPEFNNPDINGYKSKSGIIETYNDIDGSYTVENANGGKVKIMPDGSVEVWGTKFITHTPSELNDGIYGIVTSSPICTCPFSGKPHAGSSTCYAAD